MPAHRDACTQRPQFGLIVRSLSAVGTRRWGQLCALMGRLSLAHSVAALRVVWPLRRSAQARALEGVSRHQAAAAQMITMGGRTVHLAHRGIRGCQRW